MKSQDIEHLKNTIQLAKDINDTDRSKLLELLNTFSGYGLVWVDKQEDNENKILNGQMPVLNENLDRYIKARPTPPQIVEEKNANQTTLSFETVEDVKSEDNTTEQAAPHHLLIEGDNLPALTALTYTHEGLVDVIYIDPPYNTGNKDFKYNDRFVDKEDPYRHSKWLSFMHKRLLIAKRLLKNTGVIFISIDDNEQANLKLLCDEVFGEQNFVSNVIWQKKYSPQNDDKGITSVHEYLIVYSKNKSVWRPYLLKRSEENIARYKNPDLDKRGVWKAGDLTSKTKAANHSYPITSPTNKIHYPTSGRQWAPSLETVLKPISH
jgi:adenine-specific DNA-methyltransferase